MNTRIPLAHAEACAAVPGLASVFNVLVAQLYNNTKNQAIVNQEQVKRIVSL
jgi:hypothetical protein